ncbi:hypothetical protein HanRHA438_Chr05g0240311 [Helianthus annuus]|uniref:Uncharacterized protein n=1 Tax=Helianthus annuus TaxID=4232 RepID=A0A251UT24_HELAN|nr:hypothetical protein HanXRQr2_Chr05g0231041 [Helianthus annuus]KAJ0920346.1 hypothetical protein HanRHA438_Chr05g0240311 [Helianthus annuus]KAJ0923967.1 hypothetical protein HanPSC8_Chr05g0222821 [Helianthus annuus]
MNLVAVVQDVDLVLRWPLVAVGRIRDGQTIQHKSLQVAFRPGDPPPAALFHTDSSHLNRKLEDQRI